MEQTEIMQLPEAIYNARMKQLELKREVAAAQTKYLQEKARAYLKAIQNKDSHYVACHKTNLNIDVMEAHNALNEAEFASYECWAEQSRLSSLLSLHRPNIQFSEGELTTPVIDA